MTPTVRRFGRGSAARTASTGVLILAIGLLAPGAAQQKLELRYGVAAFGKVDPLAQVDTLAKAGFDYIEPALSHAVALPPDKLAAARKRVEASGLRVESMNWFLPGADIKLTGPDVDPARIREYLQRALPLAESFGARVIVFGSPGARSVPDGFPRERAWEQLRDFLRTCGEMIDAGGYGLTIGIEPLRKPESNIINTVTEALRLARDVNHPRVRIIVDFYHLAFENENPDVVLEAADMIVHLQIADPESRMFPATDAREPRYRRFFENLHRIGYQGRISVEANSDDLARDAPTALAFLRRMTASVLAR